MRLILGIGIGWLRWRVSSALLFSRKADCALLDAVKAGAHVFERLNIGEQMSNQRLIFTAVLVAMSLILSACVLYKPARVMMPEIFGLTCPTTYICIDDEGATPEATKLRADAISFVEAKVGDFQSEPRILFCTTEECFKKFGNPLISAQNIGTYGVVINATGWNDYIIRHELIHHLQNERFGVAQASYRLPRWFIEGMAYTMSEDPRRPLPRPEIETYRAQFDAWIALGNNWQQPPERDKK